jgi:diphthine synthase
MCVGVCRIGCDNQCIMSGTMQELLTADFGPPLHSFIIPGELHPLEEEMLAFYRKPTEAGNPQPTNDEDRV